jgi:hypothetical protein
MGKQKLNIKTVKLIKHLQQHHGFKDTKVSNTLGNVSRNHVNHIKQGIRWNEVPAPTMEYGEELYYRFLRKGNLNDEE